MITFKEYLLEADTKSQETKEYLAKQRDKSKRRKLKHTDKKQSEHGHAYVSTGGTPWSLTRQSGL